MGSENLSGAVSDSAPNLDTSAPERCPVYRPCCCRRQAESPHCWGCGRPAAEHPEVESRAAWEGAER